MSARAPKSRQSPTPSSNTSESTTTFQYFMSTLALMLLVGYFLAKGVEAIYDSGKQAGIDEVKWNNDCNIVVPQGKTTIFRGENGSTVYYEYNETSVGETK